MAITITIRLVDIVYTIAAFIVAVIILKGLENLLRSRLVSRLHEKYVLVTGCDSGFGHIVTRQLDRKGVHVFAACLTETGRKELEAKTSERVITLRLDVTDHESIEEAFRFVQERLPKDTGLWGLVNNAGIALVPGLLEWTTRQDYERLLAVNLIGVIDVTTTFLPLLKKARGRVVNIGSALARVAMGCGSGYAESKYAIHAFSDILRRESQAQGYGIKVSILEPGFFKTQLTDPERTRQQVKGCWDRLSPEKKAQFDPHLHEELANVALNLFNLFSSPNVTIVTTAMVHGLLSRWPKTRYSLGLDFKLVFLPLSYLPTCFVDKLLKTFLNTDPPEISDSQWARF